MTKPIIRIHNAETDEVIDREMNNDEFKQYQINQLNYANAEAEAEANAAAKSALLNRLGITAEEAALLLL